MTRPMDGDRSSLCASAQDRVALREMLRTEMLATAPPRLTPVAWQMLAWAVEDRMAGRAGSASELRRATIAAINDLSRQGMPSDDAVSLVRTLILRLAGVRVDHARRASAGGTDDETPVARAS